MTVGNFTPRETVGELDRYIIGQHKAKRAVAIALRNRWRRQQVTSDLRDEIAPRNIIRIRPTGLGKTEIARRPALSIAARRRPVSGSSRKIATIAELSTTMSVTEPAPRRRHRAPRRAPRRSRIRASRNRDRDASGAPRAARSVPTNEDA